jgi:hypothetical protein
MLELARRRIRGLVRFLDKRKRAMVYANFRDELGDDDRRLYESPFTDFDPRGPDVMFSDDEVNSLIVILDSVWAYAAPALTVAS